MDGNGGWKLVTSKRASSQHRRRPSRVKSAPTADDSHQEEEDEDSILLRMERSMCRLRDSEFFKRFLEQVESPGVAEKLRTAASFGTCARSPAPCRDLADVTSELEDRFLESSNSENGNVEGLTFLHRLSKDELQEGGNKPIPSISGEGVHMSPLHGTEWKLQIVLYGLGRIAVSEISRCQFALILLLRQKFAWVGDIEVYDPVLSQSERKAIQALGCSSVAVNEEGRRIINRPTLFYMPHCEEQLYDNLLCANWTLQKLSSLVILGNSFNNYQEQWSSFPAHKRQSKTPPAYLLEFQQRAHEIPLEATSTLGLSAFNDMSWHFLREVSDRSFDG